MDELNVCNSPASTLKISTDSDNIVPKPCKFQSAHFTLSCKLCLCKFRTTEETNKHVEDFHIPSSPLICKKCSKILKSTNGFTRHVKNTHRPKKSCPHCDYESNRPINLREHIQKRHSDRDKNLNLQECKTCGLTFALARNLRSHIKYTHLENQEKRCGECGKEFSNKYYLQSHTRLQHTLNFPKFTCVVCILKFKTRWNLKRHCGCQSHKNNCERNRVSSNMVQSKLSSLPKKVLSRGTKQHGRRTRTPNRSSVKLYNSTSKNGSVNHRSRQKTKMNINVIKGKVEIVNSERNSNDVKMFNQEHEPNKVEELKVDLKFPVVDLRSRISKVNEKTEQLTSMKEEKVVENPIKKKVSKLHMVRLLKCKNKTWSDSHQLNSVRNTLVEQNSSREDVHPEIFSSVGIENDDNCISKQSQSSSGMFGLGHTQTQCVKTISTIPLPEAVARNTICSPRLVWTGPRSVTLLLADDSENCYGV